MIVPVEKIGEWLKQAEEYGVFAAFIHHSLAQSGQHRAVEWEPWASLGMRRVPTDNYVIYCLVDKERRTVTVVRVFCGGRNVEETIKGE